MKLSRTTLCTLAVLASSLATGAQAQSPGAAPTAKASPPAASAAPAPPAPAPAAATAAPAPEAPPGDAPPPNSEVPTTPAPPAPFAAPLAETLEGESKQAYESALLLYRSGDMRTAFIKFEEAYGLSKDPRLLWNMAACQRGLRRYARVEALIQRYLREAGPRLSEEERAEADRSLEALAPLVAPVRIDTSVAGATIYLDGERLGVSPLVEPVTVEVGPHELRAELEGYEPARSEIAVGREKANRVELRLRAIPKEGKLVVAAPAGATIRVDGKVVGTTRYEASFAPGTHRVLVEAEGYQPREAEVAIAAGATRSLDVALLPIEGGVPAWAWIGGGTLVTGGLVVAAYFIFQPADPIQPAGNFDPGNVVVYPNQVKTPFALSF